MRLSIALSHFSYLIIINNFFHYQKILYIIQNGKYIPYLSLQKSLFCFQFSLFPLCMIIFQCKRKQQFFYFSLSNN